MVSCCSSLRQALQQMNGLRSVPFAGSDGASHECSSSIDQYRGRQGAHEVGLRHILVVVEQHRQLDVQIGQKLLDAVALEIGRNREHGEAVGIQLLP